MRIAVIGGSSKTVSSFIYLSKTCGHAVSVFVRSTSDLSEANILPIEPNIRTVEGDVSRLDALSKLIHDAETVLVALDEPFETVKALARAIAVGHGKKIKNICLITSNLAAISSSFSFRYILKPYALASRLANHAKAEAELKKLCVTHLLRISFTIIQPAQLVDLPPVKDVVLYSPDSVGREELASFGGQLTHGDLAGALLDTIEKARYRNAVVCANSHRKLVPLLDAKGGYRELMGVALFALVWRVALAIVLMCLIALAVLVLLTRRQ